MVHPIYNWIRGPPCMYLRLLNIVGFHPVVTNWVLKGFFCYFGVSCSCSFWVPLFWISPIHIEDRQWENDEVVWFTQRIAVAEFSRHNQHRPVAGYREGQYWSLGELWWVLAKRFWPAEREYSNQVKKPLHLTTVAHQTIINHGWERRYWNGRRRSSSRFGTDARKMRRTMPPVAIYELENVLLTVIFPQTTPLKTNMFPENQWVWNSPCWGDLR